MTHFDAATGTVKNLEIRFIDFGLSESFQDEYNNNNHAYFLCDKYVGKTGYKAPKVYHKQPFMANKADVWSLGICLFKLSIGAPPFTRPSPNDAKFKLFSNGQMKAMLTVWGRLKYITKKQYGL